MQGTQAKILIVDDEPSIRTLLSLLLAEIGYSVRTAEEGNAALEAIRHEVPDILISDLFMPGMSGFDLLFLVRQRFPAMLTIAMSGAFQGSQVPSGVAAHAFFQKGCNIGSLLAILNSLHQSECPSTQSSDRRRAERRMRLDGQSDFNFQL
jgi:DNA-binding NtrC family response regulator